MGRICFFMRGKICYHKKDKTQPCVRLHPECERIVISTLGDCKEFGSELRSES